MKHLGYFLLSLITLLPFSGFSQTPVITAVDTIGCGSLTTTFSQSEVSPTSISWDFGDGQSSIELTPTHTYSAPGYYNVSVTVNGTQTATNTNYIKVFEVPQASIDYRGDTTTASYLVVALTSIVSNESKIVNLPLSYKWTIDGDNEGTNKNAVHTFDTTGTYAASVIISDTRGCADTATFAVNVLEKIEVPNVFTPNNDGVNDLFIVSANEKYYLNFQLFTRAGLSVYKIRSKKIEWDGKMPSGEDVAAGIYFYIIETEDANPPIKEKGFLYIYR